MKNQKNRGLKPKNSHYRALWREFVVLLAPGVFVLIYMLNSPAVAAMGHLDGSRSSPYSSERQEISGLPRFEKIQANLGEISVRYGAEPQVFIENAHHLDTLYVDDEGTLHIKDTRELMLRGSLQIFGWRPRWKRKNRDQLTITLPVLKEIRAAVGADFSIGPGFQGSDLRISSSSGADFTTEGLEFDSLTLELSSGSDFRADAARLKNLDLNISSGADVEVVNLAPQARLRLESSGGGDFELQSEGEGSIGEARIRAGFGADVQLYGFAADAPLYVDISGGADLHYSGKPNIVERKVSAGSDLIALD